MEIGKFDWWRTTWRMSNIYFRLDTQLSQQIRERGNNFGCNSLNSIKPGSERSDGVTEGRKDQRSAEESKMWPRVHNDVAPLRRSLDQRERRPPERVRDGPKDGARRARSKEAATTRKIVNKLQFEAGSQRGALWRLLKCDHRKGRAEKSPTKEARQGEELK